MKKATLKRGRPTVTTIARAYRGKRRAYPPVIVHGRRGRIYHKEDGGYVVRFDDGMYWYSGNTKCRCNINR